MSNMNRVIIHSFHSQVPDTVADMDRQFKLVIALDSHIDWHLSTEGEIDAYPKRIRPAAGRASAHAMLRYVVGGLPLLGSHEKFDPKVEFVLAVPQRMFITEAVSIQDIYEQSRINPFEENLPEERVGFFRKFLLKYDGINLFLSPPDNLLKLLPKARSLSSWLLDIDVDYIREMQGECYTPITNATPGELSWAEVVLRFIRKSRPKIITISEAKVSAVEDRNSNFSKFVERLSSSGYEIEKRLLYKSDEPAVRSINEYSKFYHTIQKPMLLDHERSGSSDEFEKHREKLFQAIRDYFGKSKNS